MSKPLRFFIAGIIQGSLPDTVHPQDYRGEIKGLIEQAFPGAEIFDPVAHYPDSIAYTEEKASFAFFDLMDRAGQTDVLIAFIPEASMGTAIELWNSHHAGSYVVAVSGLTLNWVVKYLADVVYPDLETLEAAIACGELAEGIRGKLGR